MFKEKYIADNELIKPDEQLLASLRIHMKTYSTDREECSDATVEKRSKKKRNQRRILVQYGSIAACLLILFISIATYQSLKNANQKKSSLDLQETVVESTADSSYDMTSEYASDSMEERAASGAESSSKKSAKMDEQKAALAMEAPPSSSFVDGKFAILGDIVNTVLISGIPESDYIPKELTDKGDVLDIIDVLNTLTLTAAKENLQLDSIQDRYITLQYNNGSGDDIIQINNNSLKVNDSGWYTIKENELKQLNKFLKE